MRPLHLAALLAPLLAGCAPAAGPGLPPRQAEVAPGERVVEFTGGRWFTGDSFVARTAYAVGGALTFDRPARIDSTVELGGGYVVPPFGEAHNHNVERSARLAETLARYLREGILYVKDPNNLPRSRWSPDDADGRPSGVEVAFANGGLTAPGGHPISVVQRNLDREIWTEADGEGAFYFSVSDEGDLDRVWPAVLAGRPDFVKTYLLHSEEHERRKDDPEYVGWRGLDPDLLPEIVRRAHGAGLRVTAHVETAADFHAALVAGVDEIGHMPGFRPDPHAEGFDPSVYEIAEADARLAARQGTVVVTTLGGVAGIDPDGPAGEVRRAVDGLHARNLRLLLRHGVRLAAGSDDYGGTSAGEVAYLRSLGVMDELALLKLWAEATPRAVFPDREVGCLREGCEASFLVLRGDPLEEFDNTQRIALRVARGRVLAVPDDG